ncbi:MAG: serine hydrolase [Saprospiraceae bacterium]|nr:serine hydrolase [Saprospiraceae bacterium]
MQNRTSKPSQSSFFRRRNVAIISFAIGILITTISAYFYYGKSIESAIKQTPPYEIKRLSTYKNIRPIISVEPKDESPNLKNTKAAVGSLIDSLKKEGILKDASIYFRKTSTSEWISINNTIRYHPASLMKVAMMLAWLKSAEAVPGTLEKKLTAKIDDAKLPSNPYFKAPSIEDGKQYSVHDLIYHMIAHSDNRATSVLEQNSDARYATMLLNQLGLPPVQAGASSYMLTASEYSMFIKAIYNSTFNSPEYSQYASEMMENSSFKEGFAKGFPAGTKIWHKFGEWSAIGSPDELHQSGVVIIGNEPYILTIMTRGKGFDNLTKVLAMLSNRVYTSAMKFS